MQANAIESISRLKTVHGGKLIAEPRRKSEMVTNKRMKVTFKNEISPRFEDSVFSVPPSRTDQVN